MGFFDTISDLFGGGGSEYTPDGGASASTRSSNYSYSDLGQSPGAMGGRSPSFGGGDRTPPSPTETTDFVSTPVPTVSPPSTSFQLGFGGSPEGTNIAQDYMNNLNTLMGGGGSSADASAVSVSDSDTTMAALRRGAPALMASNAAEEAVQTAVAPPKFVFDYGFGTAGSPQSPEDFRKEEEKIASMTGGASNTMGSSAMSSVPGVPDFVAIGGGTSMSPGAVPFSGTPPKQTFEQQPKADANQLAKYYEGLIAGKGSPKTEQEKTFLSRIKDFLKNPGSTILGFFENLLQGDPNFKGPSAAQLDLMGVPGPGPEVGGGVPSPSGGGDAGGAPQNPIYSETPAETVMKKDPCPPGFKLDPILNQCMPIVKAAPTPPPVPTLPQPTAPTGGGIANVYPFTLTPPAGAPIGTVAPIRFTPK